MLDTISATVQPIIVEALLALILGAITWLGRKLPAQMKVNIEAHHRDALHSALNTGVGYALDAAEAAIRLNPAVATADATIGRVLEYTERSVPDAIKRLGPSRQHLEEMARAKLTEALAKMGLDPLTNALAGAGVTGPGA